MPGTILGAKNLGCIFPLFRNKNLQSRMPTKMLWEKSGHKKKRSRVLANFMGAQIWTAFSPCLEIKISRVESPQIFRVKKCGQHFPFFRPPHPKKNQESSPRKTILKKSSSISPFNLTEKISRVECPQLGDFLGNL